VPNNQVSKGVNEFVEYDHNYQIVFYFKVNQKTIIKREE